MASTVQLQNTINWAQGFLGFAPLNLGSSNEPAITSANIIVQTILSPPFAWAWNRATTTITTVAGTQDYTVSGLTAFGYLEKATINSAIELTIKHNLSASTATDRPVYIAVHADDGAGDITFRLMPVPDQAYTITLDYQKAPGLFTSLTQAWNPIPDYYQFIYSWGFLALMYEYFNNPRAVVARQIFVASLLGVASGLSAEEKDLFMSLWLSRDKQEFRVPLSAQLEQRARAT